MWRCQVAWNGETELLFHDPRHCIGLPDEVRGALIGRIGFVAAQQTCDVDHAVVSLVCGSEDERCVPSFLVEKFGNNVAALYAVRCVGVIRQPGWPISVIKSSRFAALACIAELNSPMALFTCQGNGGAGDVGLRGSRAASW